MFHNYSPQMLISGESNIFTGNFFALNVVVGQNEAVFSIYVKLYLTYPI